MKRQETTKPKNLFQLQARKRKPGKAALVTAAVRLAQAQEAKTIVAPEADAPDGMDSEAAKVVWEDS